MEYLKLSILKTYATLKGYMQLVKNKKDKFKLNTTNTKKVKIIATVGPATASEDMIRRMFQAGVNGFRLNFSHGTYEWHEEIFKLIKKISEEKNKPVAIIQDLNGPKVQLGELLCPAELELGKTYKLAFQPKQTKTDIIPILHDLSKYMKPGEKLYINDGKIKSIVTAVKRHSGLIFIKITQPGKIISNKGINIPDTNIHSNSITERDIEDVKFGLKLGFDYIALSFIQSEAEVNFFKQMISAAKKHTKIISKIETKSSLQELDKIIEASDAIMVARGDLAPEVGPEKVPIIQREIINKCQNRGKICIVATQMLSSMVNSSVPTRAEVSDIATAVILRTDAVMLSEETAIGEFAIESINQMADIIRESQDYEHQSLINRDRILSKSESVAAAGIKLAEELQAKAIVAETSSGNTALNISSFRPIQPIIAVTQSPETASTLAIAYGTKSFIRPVNKNAGSKLTDWLLKNNVFNQGDIVVGISGKYPGKSGSTDTIKLRVI